MIGMPAAHFRNEISLKSNQDKMWQLIRLWQWQWTYCRTPFSHASNFCGPLGVRVCQASSALTLHTFWATLNSFFKWSCGCIVVYLGTSVLACSWLTWKKWIHLFLSLHLWDVLTIFMHIVDCFPQIRNLKMFTVFMKLALCTLVVYTGIRRLALFKH